MGSAWSWQERPEERTEPLWAVSAPGQVEEGTWAGLGSWACLGSWTHLGSWGHLESWVHLESWGLLGSWGLMGSRAHLGSSRKNRVLLQPVLRSEAKQSEGAGMGNL